MLLTDEQVRTLCFHGQRLASETQASLPAFDTYLLGYRQRTLAVADEFAARVNAGSGIIQPTLTAGGHVLGTWRSLRRTNSLQVAVELFVPRASAFLPSLQRAIEREVADIGRFLSASAMLALSVTGTA